MRKLLLTLTAFLLAGSAWSIPARRATFDVTQPDGTVVTVQLVGDENFHYFLNVKTGEKMLRNDAGFFYVPSEARLAELQSYGMKRAEMASGNRAERFEKNMGCTMEQRQQLLLDGPKRTPGNFNGNMTGSKKGLVILVNFTDKTFSGNSSRQEFDNMFNIEGYSNYGHVGSVHDYFKDQSYGQFDLTFDVVGPVTVSHEYSYYGKNDATYGNDMYPAKMVSEACNLVDAEVNFKDYDWDGDGEVDQVFVVYAGYGAHNSGDENAIWPHESWLSYGNGTSALSLDGEKIDTYACSCELRGASGTDLNGIGAACHEFSHCIGYPDFYDTTYGGGFGMNIWDLLDQGCYNGPTLNGEIPCGYTAYERWMAGWLTPTKLDDGVFVEDMKALNDTAEAYVVYNSRYSNEYFLLENRQDVKWFKYQGGYNGAHGLLITHVDYNKTSWANNTVNNAVNHQRMSVVPADADYGSKNGGSYYPNATELKGDPFPGAKKVTEFTDDSHLSTGGKLFNRNSDGSYKLRHPITEIKENNNQGTISFTFNGGPDDGSRWTITYDAGSNGTTSVTTWTQKSCREKTTLPEATTTEEGWKFLGWSPEKIDAATGTRPEILLQAGEAYQPLDNVTLYAIFGYNTTGEWADTYTLADGIAEGEKYVFAAAKEEGGSYVLDAANLTTSKVRSVAMTAATIKTVGNYVAVTNPAATQIWSCSTDDDGNFNLLNGSNYLLATSSGTAVSTTSSPFGWHENFGLYATNTAGTAHYYLRASNGKVVASTAGSSSSRLYPYVYDPAPEGIIIFATVPVPAGQLEGISNVTVAPVSTVTYDLQGRRVNGAQHGIFIQNGKKIIK